MFSGKVVLITGSSSGIGAGAAIHFSKLGASVTITGRNADKLDSVAKQCEEVGQKPLVVVGDISDEQFINTLLNKTIEHYKKLDVLVNNAGIAISGGILDTTLEKYDEIFKTNVESVFILTKLAIPYLIETKGSIVNVSSIAGQRPFKESLVYCMSKSVLDHFTRCVALELAEKQVRVNSINPGPIYTDIFNKVGIKDDQKEMIFKRFDDIIPLGHMGTVEETAEAIAFLAGQDASYITGVTMAVDAGLSLASP